MQRTISINTRKGMLVTDINKNKVTLNNEILFHEVERRNTSYMAMHHDVLFKDGKIACSYDDAYSVVDLIINIEEMNARL